MKGKHIMNTKLQFITQGWDKVGTQNNFYTLVSTTGDDEYRLYAQALGQLEGKWLLKIVGNYDYVLGYIEGSLE